MAIEKIPIDNIGSPPSDPTCELPGILYVPDVDLFPGPWDCVVGTVAGHFTEGNLNVLDRPFLDLAGQGFMCLAFNVRLLPPGLPTQTTTGIYPQQTDDFKIGIEFMRNDPGGLGYSVTGFVGAIGGSGAGHHALFCTIDGTAGVDKADAAILMSPVTDASDREADVTQAFIDKCNAYFDTTDLPTLLERSPISLDLAEASPILHYNGDSESMPLSQLTRFRDEMDSLDVANYEWRINTGQLGQRHSYSMWQNIATEAMEWLLQWTGGTITPPPQPPPITVITPVGREGSFRRAFNRVILKLGKDPFKPLPYELTRAVVSHINERVSFICPMWRWPEWEVTEERAFRPVWNATHQWVLVNSKGKPDEVLYLEDMTYYQAGGTSASDPPVGSLPTNTSYWTPIETVDTFIEYDQTCKRPIGMVLKVWPENPRVPTGNINNGIYFQPSEKGIDVFGASKTVFITYKKPVPRYTMTPLAVGHVYLKGEMVFDTASGECYQAVSDNNGQPITSIASWRLVPLIDRWANYVVEGAFADALLELDQGGNENVIANRQIAAEANERAEKMLASACNELLIQGQRPHHLLFPPPGWKYYYKQQPWAGGEVTTLTDECEDDIIPTLPTTALNVVFRYYDDIVALLTEDGTPSLAQVVTTTQAIGSRAIFDIGDQGKEARLFAGTADSADPGQIEPDDYDADTNQKYWQIMA